MPRTRHDIDRSAKVSALLDAAEGLFRARGYSGTTIAAVARDAGVAQNSLYWYFPSKDHLFAAVLDRMLESMVGQVRARPERPLADQIIYVAERLEETQALGAALADRARESDVVAEFALRMQATMRSLLLEGLQAATPVSDPDLLADAILALANGTHGMPRAARRKLLSFGVSSLLAANS